jgi:hypothetical protein
METVLQAQPRPRLVRFLPDHVWGTEGTIDYGLKNPGWFKRGCIMRNIVQNGAVLLTMSLGAFGLSIPAYAGPGMPAANPMMGRSPGFSGRLVYAPWYGQALARGISGGYGSGAYSPYGMMPSYGARGMSPSYANPYAPSSNPYSSLASPDYGDYSAYGYAGSSMRNQGRAPGYSRKEEMVNKLLGEKGIDWPLGLRILPSEESTTLRSEVETFVKMAVYQETSGHVSSKLVSKVKRDLTQLRRLLNKQADRLPVSPYTITEAKRFLKRLKSLVEAL